MFVLALCLVVDLLHNTLQDFVECCGLVVLLFDLLPAALRAAQICRYLFYSEADFEVFRPCGATRCTDVGEIWHGGGSSMPNFTHIGATTRV